MEPVTVRELEDKSIRDRAGLHGPSITTVLDEAKSAGTMRADEIFLHADRWIPDIKIRTCMRCRIEFGLLTRKHHCRVCGGVFCDTCSNRRLFNQRVCHKCWIKVTRAVEDDTRKKVVAQAKTAATAAAVAAANATKAAHAGSAAADKIRARLNAPLSSAGSASGFGSAVKPKPQLPTTMLFSTPAPPPALANGKNTSSANVSSGTRIDEKHALLTAGGDEPIAGGTAHGAARSTAAPLAAPVPLHSALHQNGVAAAAPTNSAGAASAAAAAASKPSAPVVVGRRKSGVTFVEPTAADIHLLHARSGSMSSIGSNDSSASNDSPAAAAAAATAAAGLKRRSPRMSGAVGPIGAAPGGNATSAREQLTADAARVIAAFHRAPIPCTAAVNDPILFPAAGAGGGVGWDGKPVNDSSPNPFEDDTHDPFAPNAVPGSPRKRRAMRVQNSPFPIRVLLSFLYFMAAVFRRLKSFLRVVSIVLLCVGFVAALIVAVNTPKEQFREIRESAFVQARAGGARAYAFVTHADTPSALAAGGLAVLKSPLYALTAFWNAIAGAAVWVWWTLVAWAMAIASAASQVPVNGLLDRVMNWKWRQFTSAEPYLAFWNDAIVSSWRTAPPLAVLGRRLVFDRIPQLFESWVQQPIMDWCVAPISSFGWRLTRSFVGLSDAYVAPLYTPALHSFLNQTLYQPVDHFTRVTAYQFLTATVHDRWVSQTVVPVVHAWLWTPARRVWHAHVAPHAAAVGAWLAPKMNVLAALAVQYSVQLYLYNLFLAAMTALVFAMVAGYVSYSLWRYRRAVYVYSVAFRLWWSYALLRVRVALWSCCGLWRLSPETEQNMYNAVHSEQSARVYSLMRAYRGLWMHLGHKLAHAASQANVPLAPPLVDLDDSGSAAPAESSHRASPVVLSPIWSSRLQQLSSVGASDAVSLSTLNSLLYYELSAESGRLMNYQSEPIAVTAFDQTHSASIESATLSSSESGSTTTATAVPVHIRIRHRSAASFLSQDQNTLRTICWWLSCGCSRAHPIAQFLHDEHNNLKAVNAADGVDGTSSVAIEYLHHAATAQSIRAVLASGGLPPSAVELAQPLAASKRIFVQTADAAAAALTPVAGADSVVFGVVDTDALDRYGVDRSALFRRVVQQFAVMLFGGNTQSGSASYISSHPALDQLSIRVTPPAAPTANGKADVSIAWNTAFLSSVSNVSLEHSLLLARLLERAAADEFSDVKERAEVKRSPTALDDEEDDDFYDSAAASSRPHDADQEYATAQQQRHQLLADVNRVFGSWRVQPFVTIHEITKFLFDADTDALVAVSGGAPPFLRVVTFFKALCQLLHIESSALRVMAPYAALYLLRNAASATPSLSLVAYETETKSQRAAADDKDNFSLSRQPDAVISLAEVVSSGDLERFYEQQIRQIIQLLGGSGGSGRDGGAKPRRSAELASRILNELKTALDERLRSELRYTAQELDARLKSVKEVQLIQNMKRHAYAVLTDACGTKAMITETSNGSDEKSGVGANAARGPVNAFDDSYDIGSASSPVGTVRAIKPVPFQPLPTSITATLSTAAGSGSMASGSGAQAVMFKPIAAVASDDTLAIDSDEHHFGLAAASLPASAAHSNPGYRYRFSIELPKTSATAAVVCCYETDAFGLWCQPFVPPATNITGDGGDLEISRGLIVLPPAGAVGAAASAKQRKIAAAAGDVPVQSIVVNTTLEHRISIVIASVPALAAASASALLAATKAAAGAAAVAAAADVTSVGSTAPAVSVAPSSSANASTSKSAALLADAARRRALILPFVTARVVVSGFIVTPTAGSSCTLTVLMDVRPAVAITSRSVPYIHRAVCEQIIDPFRDRIVKACTPAAGSTSVSAAARSVHAVLSDRRRASAELYDPVEEWERATVGALAAANTPAAR